MKTIIISESQAKMLKENMHMINEKMSEEAFISHVKNYLKQLLTNPIGAQPDAFLKSNGLDGKTLLPKLLDYDIIVKKTKIVSEGKDRFEIVYKIPRNNFEKKILRLYNELFDDDTKEINESVNQELLAPNGKPSNLPANLWKLVRTPQFKNWFGDWENDPKNASKCIDENGEPMVMIHNTYNEFTKFEPNRSIAKSGAIWFANEEAQPHIGGFKTNDTRPMRQMPCFLKIMKPCYDDMDAAYYAKEEGYDGVILTDDSINYAMLAVVYSPNQIKSVNNLGNFSIDSDDINEGYLHEDGAAGVGVAGATTCDGSSGAFIQPMSSTMIKKSIYGVGIKTKKDDSEKINENVNEELLAPNGKPSKLPKKLWELVRTPQFKNWFGDWENDPENASKAVHPETGEPLILYHGSPNDFNEFSLSHFGEANDFGSVGKGFYFTPHEKYANRYGDYVKVVFLNIRRPLIDDWEDQEAMCKCFILGSPTIQDVYYRIDKMVEINMGDPKEGEEIKNMITPELLRKVNASHDGTMPPVSKIFRTGSEFVVVHPNQIKSINNINFSLSSNNINEVNEVNEEAVMDTAIGDFGYDAPPFKKKKKDPAYDHRNMMKKSFRRK